MFSDIVNVIKKSKNIVILPHKSADGDCLGSAYAMKLALVKMGKNAEVIVDGEDNENRIFGVLYDISSKETKNFDIAIAIDCGDEERIGDRISIFNKANETINIDHHPTNTKFARHNFVDSTAAATCEIVYELLQFMELKITPEIANNIYIGIISDTGGFSYSNTTARTHSIAGQLINIGINAPYIHKVLYGTNSYKRICMMKEGLQNFQVFDDGKIATITIYKDQIDKYDADGSDCSGLISLPRSLEGVVVSFCLRETNDGVKVSMRSDLVDVSRIAQKFGGGGHVKASGCTFHTTCEEALKRLIYEAQTAIKLETKL